MFEVNRRAGLDECALAVRITDDPLELIADGERHDVLLDVGGGAVKVSAGALEDHRDAVLCVVADTAFNCGRLAAGSAAPDKYAELGTIQPRTGHDELDQAAAGIFAAAKCIEAELADFDTMTADRAARVRKMSECVAGHCASLYRAAGDAARIGGAA